MKMPASTATEGKCPALPRYQYFTAYPGSYKNSGSKSSHPSNGSSAPEISSAAC